MARGGDRGGYQLYRRQRLAGRHHGHALLLRGRPGGGDAPGRRLIGLEHRAETLTPQYQYVWSAQSDAPILRDTCDANGAVIADDRVYYTTDAEGNVTTLTDSGGNPVERYVYDPYGNVSVYDNANWTGTPGSTSSYGDTFLYGGMMYDSATGLYYARGAVVQSGRWPIYQSRPDGLCGGRREPLPLRGRQPGHDDRPWGLSGGGGGNGTWDPGNVSPLMPMVAPDTPCDGPMVTEMGLNVPSQLMPMIAPDTPFEGPMVNYLDAYGSPWMPMHSPDEPFEGPMVNEIGASVPSPLMPMIAPDTPFEGPMVNEIGAGLPPQLMPMVAPDTPFEGPMVNEIGASTLYGGEMIPLLPPGAVLYFARRLDVEHGHRRARLPLCFSYAYGSPGGLRAGRRPAHASLFRVDGGDSQREFRSGRRRLWPRSRYRREGGGQQLCGSRHVGYVPRRSPSPPRTAATATTRQPSSGAWAGRRFSLPPAWGWPTRTSASATPASPPARRC